MAGIGGWAGMGITLRACGLVTWSNGSLGEFFFLEEGYDIGKP
jgi:hypothetical protein